MKLVKPSFQILTDIKPKEILKNIELAGRFCKKLLRKIMKIIRRKK